MAANDANMSAAQVARDLQDYPFLIKTLITFTKLNAQGTEVKLKDEVVFKLDRASATMPWYTLRNYTVPKFLTQKYGPFEVAWQRIYEIRIDKLICRANPADITDIPLRVMTLEQLEAYCVKWELNVPVYDFYSVTKAREMVALREQDEKGYQKHLAEYKDGKQRSYPELDNMRGDAKAATADAEEFNELDKQAMAKPKSGPEKAAEVVEPTKQEAAALDTGSGIRIDQTGQQGLEKAPDPFAGV